MMTVAAALLPVFLLLALGNGLRHSFLDNQAFWDGLERLLYFVLFPALLVDTLARVNLSSVPLAGVGGALLLAVLMMSALCMALRPLLAARMQIDGPAFSSVFQGATRWQTFIALSIAGSLYGEIGITLASIAMVAMTPVLNVFAVAVLARYAAPRRLNGGALLGTIARNPMILSCLLGLAINFSGIVLPSVLHAFLESLGRCSLAIAILIVGAGLQIERLRQPSFAAWLTVGLKLVVMPLMALGLGVAFGLTGSSLAVVACCASVPSASGGYILARQMGGDAPLLAQILVLQTIVAFVTMPIFIFWSS